MILSLFRPKEADANARIVDASFETIVAAARQPKLYADWGMPDTPLGRYESLSLHLILFLYRTRRASAAVKSMEQEIVDEFFKDIDHSVRELGVGDAGVPKRMKKLGKMFYGRMGPYWEALDARDEKALADAITRNITPEGAKQTDGLDGVALSHYALQCADQLAEISDQALLNGQIRFVEAQLGQ
ncbi:MAG: ubiquinol-cytochrome C chaperone family protein [Pseudomonadota bacterium]